MEWALLLQKRKGLPVFKATGCRTTVAYVGAERLQAPDMGTLVEWHSFRAAMNSKAVLQRLGPLLPRRSHHDSLTRFSTADGK
jgi:hypothetical protein